MPACWCRSRPSTPRAGGELPHDLRTPRRSALAKARPYIGDRLLPYGGRSGRSSSSARFFGGPRPDATLRTLPLALAAATVGFALGLVAACWSVPREPAPRAVTVSIGAPTRRVAIPVAFIHGVIGYGASGYGHRRRAPAVRCGPRRYSSGSGHSCASPPRRSCSRSGWCRPSSSRWPWPCCSSRCVPWARPSSAARVSATATASSPCSCSSVPSWSRPAGLDARPRRARRRHPRRAGGVLAASACSTRRWLVPGLLGDGWPVDGPPGSLETWSALGRRIGRIDLGPKRSGHYAPSSWTSSPPCRPGGDRGRQRRSGRPAEQRLVELSASRVRLVVAQDDERRRIERDLHDGIQQNVVALIAGLRWPGTGWSAASSTPRARGAAGAGPETLGRPAGDRPRDPPTGARRQRARRRRRVAGGTVPRPARRRRRPVLRRTRLSRTSRPPRTTSCRSPWPTSSSTRTPHQARSPPGRTADRRIVSDDGRGLRRDRRPGQAACRTSATGSRRPAAGSRWPLHRGTG